MRPVRCLSSPADVFEVIDEAQALDAGITVRFCCQLCGSMLSRRDKPHKTSDPKPACECNVYAADGSGRVIAWRTYACPLHRYDGWLDRNKDD